MPIGYISGSERPDNAFAGKAILYIRIFSNIAIIVEVDKLMISHLPIDGNSGDNEK
jgi:hypothetical protein